MLLGDFQRGEMRSFPGQRSARSKARLPADQGARSVQNMEFFDESVGSRRGFETAFSANPSALRIGHMRHWFMPDWSRLMMFIPHATTPSVRVRDLGSTIEGDVVTGLAATVKVADFQEYGSRMFMAFVGADGLGKARPQVFDGLDIGAPNVDPAFLAPPVQGSAFSAAYSEPISGVVDAGVHKVGLLFETRNGFTTKAIELSASFTATGGANMRITLTPVGTWSESWAKVKPLFSTVQNPERFWIIPNVEQTNFGGTSAPVTLDVNMSDTELAALNSADSEATDFFETYVYGDNTFNLDAKALVSYSGRMVYVVDEYDAVSLGNVSRLLISDIADPQRLSLDQHQVRLPGNLPITTAAPLGNQLYIIGPATIHSTTDNLDKPVTWSEPQLVDARVGTPCLHGVGKDPSRNILFIANPEGLWPFDGATVPEKPTSYEQTDQWSRINWDAAKEHLKVLVDGGSSNVIVVAPLDAETVPTTAFVWNYRNGHSYQRVDFSTMTFAAAELNTLGGAAVVVRNNVSELWLANHTNANEVQRQKSLEAGDSNLYRDGATPDGIVSKYRTGELPKTSAGMLNVHAAHLGVSGNGDLGVTAYAHEDRSKARNPITLAASPKGPVLRRIDMKSSGVEIELATDGTVDEWFRLDFLQVYYKPWAAER